MGKFHRQLNTPLPQETSISSHNTSRNKSLHHSEGVQTQLDLNFKNTATNNKKGLGLCWTPQQNRIYVNFLKQNQYLFSLSTRERKQIGIHILMSEVIKTRSSGQCRSHHQKMLKKYSRIKTIISELTKLLKKVKEQVNQMSKQNKGEVDKGKSNELINYSDMQLQASEDSLWEKIMDVSGSICLHDFFI